MLLTKILNFMLGQDQFIKLMIVHSLLAFIINSPETKVKVAVK